ncbi:2'-5' RNA ligase family protein [Homoserinibacter sp. YIM 151385]|uniref:2'-5' RNA ligase family protein n=1 Tax=Homoserinibacter sp. YIM 151385 TaxID=2985506 RepID=UPI0022F02F6D|nr:2'-5' RNA ligase family protein [Homoserinibacter sp. YIM 151385]WBU39304.1 2'-5' RNA ligase family protein [Homoserinibacter sp. YIM 151385]
MLRFAVCAFLEDLALGSELDRGALPLHVTLFPPSTTEADQGQLEAALEHVLAQFGPFEAAGGDDELFGARRDVEVTLVEDEGSLAAAHVGLVRALSPLGVRVPDPAHVGRGYRPHVTVTAEGDRIERGERIELDAVALLLDEGGVWRVAAQLPLI